MVAYREIFEEMPDGVTLHDPADGAILETNHQFCEMLGYSREELLGLDFEALHVGDPPYTADRAEEYIRKAATEGPQTFEWRDETKDGESIPVEVHLTLTTIDREERILAVVRDITERKRRQHVLQTERDRANALFEQLGEPIVEVGFEGDTATVDAVNTAFEDTFGVDGSDIIGEHLIDRITSKAERETARSITDRVQGGEVVEEELQRSTPDGVRTFLLRTVPYSLNDDPRAYFIYFDITDRKRQQERFQAFIQQSTDIITVLDSAGTYKYLSPSAERITGYDTDELIGEVAFEHVHPEDRKGVLEEFSEAVQNRGMGATVEYRYRHRDGSWIWLESIGNYQLENPAVEGFVVNSRDVTDRKEYEQALERQNERLDGFASVVSHDLRNPLNVAQGQRELATQDCDSEHLDAMGRALDRMEEITGDVLSLARAGNTVGERNEIDLTDIVRGCWQTVDTRSARLITETDATIRADETRLRQLLENLIRNAVEHGGEDLSITIGDLDEGFYVEDTGTGIPEDERDAVFEAGYTTTEGGTGFGLNIAKQIAEAHGWSISVTEGEDGGARFEFTDI